jgi:hypothetical protein
MYEYEYWYEYEIINFFLLSIFFAFLATVGAKGENHEPEKPHKYYIFKYRTRVLSLWRGPLSGG